MSLILLLLSVLVEIRDFVFQNTGDFRPGKNLLPAPAWLILSSWVSSVKCSSNTNSESLRY